MAALTRVIAAEVVKSGQTLAMVGRQQHSVCGQGHEGQGGGRSHLWPGLPLGKDGAARPEMLKPGQEHLWSVGKVESSVLNLGV